MFKKFPLAIAASAVLATQASAQNNTTSLISPPYDLTYLLPSNFTGNLNSTFVNGTTTSNSTINSLLSRAKSSTFISYDDEFTSIFGANPKATLIATNPGSYAYFESGVWVLERDEVWLASSIYRWPLPGYISALSLSNNTVTNMSFVTHANGGYLFDGQVYFGQYAPQGGVYAVNTTDLSVTPVINSYFGLSMNLVDDLVWVQQGNKKYLFFTLVDANLFLSASEYPDFPAAELPNVVWRWDPQEKVLLPVISRVDIAAPNGVRVSPDQRTLYVTDSYSTAKAGAGTGTVTGGPDIYAFDLDRNCLPVNKRLFGIARDGIADGLHVDDAGRVWTGEYEGIVVRSPAGKILGVVNSQALGITENDQTPLANFALAGNVLVIGAVDRLYRVDLAQTVVATDSVIVN